VGGPRADPIYNRIARHINIADQQFGSVNSGRDRFNIFAFVNHNRMSNVDDLRAILRGFFQTTGGRLDDGMLRRISKQTIGTSKRDIDAYLWFDMRTPVDPFITTNGDDPERSDRLRTLLRADPRS
jgi:hypothetical protein